MDDEDGNLFLIDFGMGCKYDEPYSRVSGNNLF